MGGEIKKKLALLLTLVLVIGTMSMPVYAKTGQTEGEQTGASSGMQTKNAAQLTSLEVGGVEITNTTSSYWKLDLNGKPTEVGASADDYDFKMKDKELYLNLKGNAIKSTDSSYLREAIMAEGDLIINLESNGTVQGDYCGIYIENGSLTVKGGYVLDVVGNDYGIDIKNYTNNNVYLMVNNNAKIDTTATKDGGVGISVWGYADGSVSISAQGGSINANAKGYMAAIYASSQNGDVSVTASQGGSIMAECDGFNICGIQANCSGDRNVSVAASDGGSITAKANGEGSRGIEIYSSYGSASVTANNSGSIKAEANGEESRGMLVGSYSGDISTEVINIGNITAEATGEGSTGLYHSTYFGESTISINSGILSTKGTEYCIESEKYESIEVKEGGIVFAESDIPDYIVISEDSNGVVFENKVGKSYGDNIALCADLKMPQGYTLTVDEGQTLNVSSGKTIDIYDENSINGQGTITGDGEFIVQYGYPQMTVPEDLTYTGEDFAEKITLSECGETVTVLGKEFKPENTIGNLTSWIRTITTRYGYVTDEIINTGEYIIKYTYNDGTNEYWFDKSIEVKEAEATITITAQPKTLQGGGKVTLTVTTEPEGLECDVDCSDNNIDIKDNGNGVFTAELENKTAEYKFYVYLDEVNYDADEQSVTVSVTEKTKSTDSSSSGGGGGSSSRYYNDIDVKEGNDTFGTVTVNPKTANKGEEVTITVEPKTGFEVDEVTVKDNGGNEVDVEKVSDTEYTFIHPGKPTDIYVSYVKAEQTEVPKEVQPDTLPFDDVPAGAWYRKAVEYAYEKGIMSGTGENMFLPNIEITRGMIVSIIWRLEGSPVVNYAMNFSDVDSSMYYSEAVRWAVSQGIANGMGDGTFGGYNNITREQLAVMLYNYAKLKGYDTTQGGMAIREFADYENISDYAKEALTWAVNAGIINGMGDGTLAPQGSATRAEAAQMIMVFCEKYN